MGVDGNGLTALAAAMLMTVGLAGAAHGQTPTTATVRGRIVDPQQRPVPGARVQASASATGWTRDASTDAEGRYVLADMPPGAFVVSVVAPGFAPQRFEGVALRVGQVLDLDAELTLAGVREDVVVDAAGAGLVDTARSVVDAAITAGAIESLPLNGRNFMELALLVPGNAPAPTFDPTKTNSVVISSAGQLGRGGNISIDGMDNNDDVVGGPLLNIVQEGVQEFQIATSRFAADLGRSAGSVINVVTRSGGDALQGSAALYFRDDSLQAFPPTADRSADAPPFDRQQLSASIGGPLRKGTVFGFGAVEYRNQDGALIVGSRDTATRTIRRSFAPAPLDDVLGLARVDWRASDNDQVLVRYAGQDAEDVASSGGDRALATASQRQQARNRYHAVLGTWTRVLSSRSVNSFSVSLSDFDNAIAPVEPGRPQYTFPSLLDGSSFRVPQSTVQRRWQFADTFSHTLGSHTLRAGGELQLVDAAFGLGVFRDGRVELVQDFPDFDHNGDGRVDDNDLLFAVTLRSGRPDQDLNIPDADNTHAAFFVQDDWRVRSNLTLNLGLRYELDTDVKNVSRYDEINPLVKGFLQGERGRDLNNWGPRVGFNWSAPGGGTSVHGGYGIYFDRITLQIQSLERGLDGRALPIEVRAGNLFFLGQNGQFPPFAPNLGNPFTGFILPGAGASGINIIDNTMQNPMTQQFNLGFEHRVGDAWRLRVDGIHALGTHFIIGRDAGVVFNPVVGGDDRVVNLESSARTHYDALLVGVERRLAGGLGVRASYTLSKASNYANDDQIPFSNGPIDPNDLRAEFGPTPNDQRHRFSLAASWEAPAGFSLSTIWTLASGVPMDILLPSAQSRIPELQRNAGGRLFRSPGDLNDYLRDLNARGGVAGLPLPLVGADARFNDRFDSLDVRIARPFAVAGLRVEPMVEIFNVFNVTNILGTSNVNYSGFTNVLVRDSEDPASPGFLTSSSFGKAVSTAGGVFGTGGPRAAQLAVRVRF